MQLCLKWRQEYGRFVLCLADHSLFPSCVKLKEAMQDVQVGLLNVRGQNIETSLCTLHRTGPI